MASDKYEDMVIAEKLVAGVAAHFDSYILMGYKNDRVYHALEISDELGEDTFGKNIRILLRFLDV